MRAKSDEDFLPYGESDGEVTESLLQLPRVHARIFVDIVLSRIAKFFFKLSTFLGESPDQGFPGWQGFGLAVIHFIREGIFCIDWPSECSRDLCGTRCCCITML
jgi:hypothetical protein